MCIQSVVLLQGGDHSLQDVEGWSPLHYAAVVKDPEHELYHWLLKEGASTQLKDKVQNKQI